MKDGEAQIYSLTVRLAEDRFNLAVVGQFKRGKSSLMNAIIGRDLLPTGILPLTSAITTLCYGPKERVLLKRKNWVLDQEIPLRALADFVTEQGNPGNEKGLLEARVELPIQFLRRGLHFIDTPGIGSAEQRNTQTTYEFIPEADAVIFVTSVEAPLSKAEQEFLQAIRQYVCKLFIIVNKMDLLQPGERESVLNYIEQGVRNVLGQETLQMFPLSARQSLEAKNVADASLLESSGLPDFEAELSTFLSHDKSTVFLVSILDQALRVVAENTSNGSYPELAAIQARLADLRERIDREMPLEASSGNSEQASATSGVLEAVIEASLDEQNQPEKAAIFQAGTCLICSVQSQAVFDFFAQWQYRLVSDERARQDFLATMGFCPVHTWQFAQIASPQGISEAYPLLIDRILRRLDSQNGDRHRQECESSAEAPVDTKHNCPACRVVQEAGTAAMQAFLQEISSARGREGYRRSPGLCVPHYQVATSRAQDAEVRDFLRREQVRRLEEITEDMRNFVLKREALRRGLLSEDERKAWRRGLVLLSSEPSAYRQGDLGDKLEG